MQLIENNSNTIIVERNEVFIIATTIVEQCMLFLPCVLNSAVELPQCLHIGSSKPFISIPTKGERLGFPSNFH